MTDSERIEAARLILCKIGLNPNYYKTLEHAIQGAHSLVESLRANLADPDAALQEACLRKLANVSPGWAERLPEWVGQP